MNTQRHTPRLQYVNDIAECRFRSLQMQRNAMCQPLPFSSYREKGERRLSSGTRAGVGDNPGNTRALFRSTRGKELDLWSGTWVFVGRPRIVTAPVKYLLPRFHTPGRCPACARFFFTVRLFDRIYMKLVAIYNSYSGYMLEKIAC
jgi:hypothetical protein